MRAIPYANLLRRLPAIIRRHRSVPGVARSPIILCPSAPLRIALLAIALGQALLVAPAAAHGDTIATFALDGGDAQSLAGARLDVTQEDLELNGVTFSAVLTVIGSNDLTQTSSGIGVAGGSTLINGGEWLRVTLAMLDVSGGAAHFLGFTQVDPTFFTTRGEEALFSRDPDRGSTYDNFLRAYAPDDDPMDLDAHRPAAFTLFGVDGFGAAGGAVSFRIDSIDAAFSATAAVPEPSSLGLLALGLVGLACARHRRKRWPS